LIDFQINPHYLNFSPPGFRGETRDQRIAEFTRLNPQVPVLGLPEGDWVRVEDGSLSLGGAKPAVWFAGTNPPREVVPGPLAAPRS
jgi:dipeptidase E